MTGDEIIERIDAEAKAPSWIGRVHGLAGAPFRDDVTTGRWHDQPYQVRFGGPLPGTNWFSLQDFLDSVRSPTRETPA